MKFRILLCTFFLLMFSNAYSQQKDACSLLTLDQEARLGVLGFKKKVEPTSAPDQYESLQTKFFTCSYSHDSSESSNSIQRFVFLSDPMTELGQAHARDLIAQYQKKVLSELPPKSEFQKIEAGFCLVVPLVDTIVASGCQGMLHRRLINVLRIHGLNAGESMTTLLQQTKILFGSVSRRLE
jgi:hypothetical protein